MSAKETIDDTEEKTGESEGLELPEVPTNEPTGDGQPDAKKRKVSGGEV
jgi:hypothetical protein